MGHANLSNLSRFFVHRLYAKGKLSIADCVQAMLKARETLHASEGEYEDEGMLSFGLTEIVNSLSEDGCYKLWRPRPDGPWIVPHLTSWHGGRRAVTPLTRTMLDEIENGSNDELTASASADRLEEEGFVEWGAAVRVLPAQRKAFAEWKADEIDEWDAVMSDGSEYETFDSIQWKFAPGWRVKYREIPLLGNITN
jgi:hypothetical protein